MPRLLPNWIEAYLAYSAENESPEVFHLWTCLAVISAALRRQVYFDMEYYLQYPNVYVVLTSPPGRCKKSTAIRIGQNLLKDSCPHVKISADSTSREKLVDAMSRSFNSGQSPLMAVSSEFGSFLTTSGVDMMVFLTDIYDAPAKWSHETRGGGTVEIKAPCLTLLAGTTPDWIAKGMPLDTIGIGLASRTLFIYEDIPRAAKPIPRLSPAQRSLYDLLKKDLQQIARINGKYEFASPEDEEWYTQWYMGRFGVLGKGDNRLAGYFDRKPTHLLRVSMLVAAACRDDTVILAQDMQMALAILESNEPRMHKVFQGVGKNPLAADLEDTLAALMLTPGGFTYAEVYDRFKHSVRKEEMTEILDSLTLIGKITFKDGKYYATK